MANLGLETRTFSLTRTLTQLFTNWATSFHLSFHHELRINLTRWTNVLLTLLLVDTFHKIYIFKYHLFMLEKLLTAGSTFHKKPNVQQSADACMFTWWNDFLCVFLLAMRITATIRGGLIFIGLMRRGFFSTKQNGMLRLLQRICSNMSFNISYFWWSYSNL